MKVALVGWDIDVDDLDCLGGLGLEISAFTRWHDGTGPVEVGNGWVVRRCPHRLGGGMDAEAWSFRESVVACFQRESGSIGDEFDVVHALDPLSRVAAEALSERSPNSVRVTTIGLTDLLGVTSIGLADRRIADHPWLFEHWSGPGAASLVVSCKALRTSGERPPPLPYQTGPLLAIWVKRGSDFDPTTVAAGLSKSCGEVSGLSVVVLGANPLAESLRRKLACVGLSPRSAIGAPDTSPSRWNACIEACSALGVSGATLAEEPAAWAVWRLGKPVISLDNRSAEELAKLVRDALLPNPRGNREIRAAAILAEHRLGPIEVAKSWLSVYLDARGDADRMTPTIPKARNPAPFQNRSRLSLVPLTPWELFAAWRIHEEDRSVLLDWFGADAPRAALTLRFHDITDLTFHGSNAHGHWDVDLAPGDRQRALRLPQSGRSVAASLGYRTPRGTFLPLTHAGPVHLPRERFTNHSTTRMLRSLPRR